MTSSFPGQSTGTSGSNLDKLFVGLYGQMPLTEGGVSDEALAAALCHCNQTGQDIAVQVRALLGGATLSPRQLGMIKVAAAILSDFFSQPAFHPGLGRELLGHSGALVAQALRPGSWLGRTTHPQVAALTEVAEFARAWYPEHPQAADISAMLARTLEGLQEGELADTMAMFRHWRDGFLARVGKVAARVIEAESGKLRSSYARALAARTISRQLAGRDLPEFMVRALDDVWLPAFQWVLLGPGEGSPVWSQLVKNFSLLVWSMQTDAAQQKSKLSRVVAQLKQELPDLLGRIISDDAQREQVLEDITLAHLCQLQDRPLERAEVDMLAGAGALDLVDAEVSADLMQEVAAIEPSQWFVLPDDTRIRLLQRVDEYQQLLFVNQLGMKTLDCSFDEFALRFSSGEILPVAELVPLSDWAQARMQGLVEQYRQRARQQQAQQREARQKSAEARRSEAKEKAIREAQLLQQQAAQPQADQPLFDMQSGQDIEASPEQRRQRARLLVTGMLVGAWLSFFDDQGREARRRLAVILPSSNKYIFVDRSGGDKLQLTRNELIDGIADGSVALVQKDERFDDALSRVVGGLQRSR